MKDLTVENLSLIVFSVATGRAVVIKVLGVILSHTRRRPTGFVTLAQQSSRPMGNQT
jgi:hypothetical protein